MELRVLGPIEIYDGHKLAVGGARHRRIIAALAMRAGEVVSIDQLASIVWPDEEQPKQPERNLRTYMSRMRGALGDELADRLVTVPPGYTLRVGRDELDAHRFEDACGAATRSHEHGESDAALAHAEDALRIWRGRPYAEFADEAWAQAEVARLEELRVLAAETRAHALLDLGRGGEAIPALEALIDEHPLRENPRGLYMSALARSGRQAEALRAFQDFRTLLIDELGVDPSARLRDLDLQIARGELAEPSVGHVRGYEVLELIGSGAFAEVHRGRQPDLGRDVAIKSVRAELANRPEFIRGFEAEASIVARLEHPAIVPLYDFWREPGRAYLVMRWLTGGTLEASLDEGPWSLEQTAKMVEQIGGALALAHRAGVVHRDVKSANILLDVQHNAYLSDFGIAVEASGIENPAAALSEGSPAYAAPEQLRRQTVGPPADIFGLGIATYEALTGRLPFADARDRSELLRRQLADPIPPASAARTGIPATVDDVLARATAKNPVDRFDDVGQFVEAFLGALTQSPNAAPEIHEAARRATLITGSVDNPYRGLQAFGEADEAVFFGRERLVDELLGAFGTGTEARRFLAVVGPSGSGKSSLVRAGLVPALRRDRIAGSADWFVTTMSPGARPYEALETALLRIAVNPPASLLSQLRQDRRGIIRGVRRSLPDDDGTALVLIDQFEELFTLCDDEQLRAQFLEALTVAVSDPDSPLRVVIALRADFYDHPLRYDGFAGLVKRNVVTVTPLAADELEQAIVRPAEEVGATFGPGLVAEIVADVASQPGSLPLMQYTLRELFDARLSGMLMVDTYHELGGLGGALGRRADDIFDSLDPDERRAARRLFGRLVNLGAGNDDTRRRALRSELGHDDAVDRVLEAYGSARLLTFDRDPGTREPTVEVAHEALIREWPRLSRWLDEDREQLRVLRHLHAAATDWEARGRADSDLYRGARLEAAESLSATAGDDLRPVERDFLVASTDRREAETAAERRTHRRLRRLIAAVSVVAVLALVAGVAALVQRGRARDEAQAAETARLAAEAPLRARADPQLGLLLAVEAHAREASPPTLGALQRTLLELGPVLGHLGRSDADYLHVAWRDDDTIVAVHPAGVEVYRVSTTERIVDVAVEVKANLPMTFTSAGATATVAIDDEGSTAAVATASGDVQVISLDDGTMTALPHDALVQSLAFDPAHDRLATGDVDGLVRVWDLGDAEVVREWDAHPEPFAAFESAFRERGWAILWDLLSGLGTLLDRGVAAMAFTPDGRLVTAADPVIRAWDLDGQPRTAGPESELLVLPENQDPAAILAIPVPLLVQRLEVPDEDPHTVDWYDRQLVVRFDLSNGTTEQTSVVTDSVGDTRKLVVSSARAAAGGLAALDGDGRVRLVSDEGAGAELARVPLDLPSSLALDPDTTRVAVAGSGGIVVLALDGDRLLADAVPLSSPASDLVQITADGSLLVETVALRGPTHVRRVTAGGAEDFELPDGLATGLGVLHTTANGEAVYSALDLATAQESMYDLSGAQLFGPVVPVSWAFSPDGRWYVGVQGRELVIWDWDAREEVARIGDLPEDPPGIGSRGSSVTTHFSADGSRLLVLNTSTHQQVVYDTASWQRADAPEVLGRGAVVASFSPDGRFLATVDVDGLVWLHDPDTFAVIDTIDGAGRVDPRYIRPDALVWSSDGSHLITAFEASPRLFDIGTREQIGDPFPVRADTEYGARSGDPLGVVTIVDDDILIWNLDTASWAGIACRAAGRNMTRDEWDRFGPRGESYRSTCPQYPPGG